MRLRPSLAIAGFALALSAPLPGCGSTPPATLDGATLDGGTSDAGALAPVVHASGLGQPEQLLLDDRALVWANKTQGTIMILDLATDEVRTLASGITGPDRALAMTPSHVYWAGWRDGSVMRVPRAGGEPEVVATIAAGTLPSGMTVSATHVYWTVFGGSVHRMPLEGGTIEDLGWAPPGNPSAPVIAGDHLYVASFTAVHRLRLAPTLATAWESVASFEGSAGGLSEIAVDAEHVYGAVTNDAIVFRVPLAGGTVEILAEDVQPSDLAIAGGRLYLARASGTLARMPLAGGPLEPFAPEPESWSVAVGSGRVFYSTHASVDSFEGTLRSIAVPD